MQKIFSFAAAMLFAVSINAQTLTFGEGSTGDQTYGDEIFAVTVAGWSGNHSATSGRQFGTLEDNKKEVGMIASGGKLDGTNRSMNIVSTYSGTVELYMCSSSSDNERDVTVNGVVRQTAKLGQNIESKDVYAVLSFDINYGTTSVTTNGAVYLYKVVFTSNGEAAPAPRDTVASYIQGIQYGSFVAGPMAAEGQVNLAFSTKYNANKTTCTAISFGKSMKLLENAPDSFYVKVTPAEGQFLAGDVIDFQPFTTMSTTDYTGAKYANIRIYGGNDTNVSLLYETAATASDKSDVTDGHEVAGDVKWHQYTLTENCEALYFGRNGGTRINVLSFIVTRDKEEEPTAVNSVTGNPSSVTHKVIENGRIVIIRDNVRYDITGSKL